MPLELEPKQAIHLITDFSGLHPTALAHQSTDAVQGNHVSHGNQTVELGELFHIRGSAKSDQTLVIVGDASCIDNIGAHMTGGHIQVAGTAGHRLGAHLGGGTIEVEGNAADNVGVGMRAGVIRVKQDVGDNAGGSEVGRHHGMTGGTLLVTGNAGQRSGCRMRRGLLAIAGNTGAMTGFEMRAGTIFVGGNTGPHLAHGMRRGTVLVRSAGELDQKQFAYACRQSPIAIQLVTAELNQAGFPRAESPSDWHLFNGDMLEGGKGEVLIAC